MADTTWERVQDVFHAAIEMTAAERTTYLDEACASDDRLRAEVEALLVSHAERPDFLESPMVAGRRIGRYELVREIGAGGMGAVYEAIQDHPRRTVALKLMRAGIPSRAALRRFTYESEILARLRHPGIAHVYEAGVHDDGSGAVPYFAMEYIPEPRTIVEFTRCGRLGVRERLDLFARVCDAVQHGHQMGVIHRDLKPANILVDGAGDPKVIDFGVARVLDADAPATTLQTGVGQLVGTLQYMSPEQCSGDPAAVDARCDVYALGIVMYELLAGEPPYELDSRSVPESIRTIGEVEPRRLSSIDRMFRGDLDTIVSKAIEKDRTRRYQSASEMAADIRRYLDDEPIVARPASALYQLGKFTRRNKALVGGLVGTFAVFVIGFVVSTVLYLRASEARDDAEFRAYVANIAAAASALRSYEITDAERRLDSAPPHLRNWEWHHLVNRLDRSHLMIEHEGLPIKCVAFSPDGSLVAYGVADGATHVRYTRDGSLALTLIGHRDVVDTLAFSPDGRLLATGARVVKLWDVASGAAVGDDLAGHTGHVHGLAFTPDGTRLASGSQDGTVRLWNVATGHAIAEYGAPQDRVVHTALSRDGRALAVSSHDGRLRVLDATTLEERAVIDAGHGKITCAAFSPGDRMLAAACGDGTILLVDPQSTEVLAILTGHASHVSSVAFSPDGGRLVSGSVDRTVRIWDVRDRRQLAVLLGHRRVVHEVAWSADGSSIASASSDGTVRLWTPSAEEVPTLRGHGAWVYDVAVSADGRFIASSGSRGNPDVRVWDRESGEQVAVLGGHGANTWSVDVSADGRLVVSGGGDGIVRLWTMDDAPKPVELTGHGSEVFTVDLSGDGRRVVSGSRDRTVRQWSVDGDEPPLVMEGHDDWIWCVAYSPDDSFVASGSRDGVVRIWDASDGALVEELADAVSGVRDLAFGADGRILCAGTKDGKLIVWRTADWRLLAVRSAHALPVYAVAIAPDGTRVATGSDDYTIKLWDVESWQEVATLHGHVWPVWSLQFTPDGRDLISGSADGTVRLWDG